MKTAILVTGPNASGKTTLLSRAYIPWYGDDRVKLIHGDVKPYSTGSPENTLACFKEDWQSNTPVLLIEGIDRTARAVGSVAKSDKSRKLIAHVTAQSADVMASHMRTRCSLRGKAYREAYWTQDRLAYEGLRRYKGLAERLFPHAEFWTIDGDYTGVRPLLENIQRTVEKLLEQA